MKAMGPGPKGWAPKEGSGWGLRRGGGLWEREGSWSQRPGGLAGLESERADSGEKPGVKAMEGRGPLGAGLGEGGA